jgi:hypothetical protein
MTEDPCEEMRRKFLFADALVTLQAHHSTNVVLPQARTVLCAPDEAVSISRSTRIGLGV